MSASLLSALVPQKGVLLSPHPPHVCGEKITAIIDGPNDADYGDKAAFGTAGVAGGLLRKRLTTKNSSHTVMYLVFQKRQDGCRIVARSYMAISALLFFLSFFGICLGIGAIAVGNALVGDMKDAEILVFAPFGMLLFGILVFILGRWLARGEHDVLLDLVATAVDGTPVQ